MSNYKLTKKAEADLDRIVAFSLEKFGPENTSLLLARLEDRMGALARHEYEGPEVISHLEPDPFDGGPYRPTGSTMIAVGASFAFCAYITAHAHHSERSP